jgi:gliding motility-associated-like protein
VYPSGADANANGLLNTYEGGTAGTINYTSSYNPYAIANNLAACLDSDADGINDEFEIVMGQTQFYRIRIYNLKGQLIFESDKQNQHWKGTNQENGQIVETGAYRYVLEYQIKEQAKPSMAVGYIYLNR